MLLVSAGAIGQNYQYLGTYDVQGTPNYLLQPSDVVDAATMDMIAASLPESYPVPQYNPHYISAGYETDIKIDEEADIWVTFVQEGAGYRNVLGFYTYDLNNPFTSKPVNPDLTIIFPNASAQYSGGGLNTGDKVHLGRFPADTGIGWVLLANAWSPSSQSVGNGQWQLFSNPDFNPESDPNLQHHNVLLNDSANDRVILGFEDIRRDYSSCDNDFNDAIFYVTANPYTAIQTENFAEVTTGTAVTSANNGGLESNGDLASLVARRNLARKKNGHVVSKSMQPSFDPSQLMTTYGANSAATLSSVLPTTGMYGTETAQISTPQDLVNITNADEIFAVDYYQQSNRVAAVLASTSTGSIYDHSKAICDRLNNSKLKDILTVPVRGHHIIASTIERENGEIEYSLSFSVKEGAAANELFSKWEIAQYPAGDFMNFQIWGSTYSQVFAIANHIIDELTAIKTLNSNAQAPRIPQVFVSSGAYVNGNLELEIINKSGAASFLFDGNLKATETSSRSNTQQTIALSGARNQSVQVPTGSLFDIGFSIQVGNEQKDALYLADGPWGLDYLPAFATVDNFDVLPSATGVAHDNYFVERDPYISGTVKGNVNLFRHLKAGEGTLDVSAYDALQFEMLNTQAVEIILVPEAPIAWDQRYKSTIAASNVISNYDIEYTDFTNPAGESYPYDDIKTVVFSIISDYTNTIPYELEINALQMGTHQGTLGMETPEMTSVKLKNAPNPFRSFTTVYLDSSIAQTSASIAVYDLLGRQVDFQKNIVVNNNKLDYHAPELKTGMYKYVVQAGDQVMNGTFMIKK